MKDNDDDITEISAGGGALVAIEVVGSIFRALVEREIMTDAQVAELLSEAAERQGQMDGRCNREAAVVLAEMARAYGGKFRRGMPTIRPGA
jgi:hypothetical protein